MIFSIYILTYNLASRYLFESILGTVLHQCCQFNGFSLSLYDAVRMRKSVIITSKNWSNSFSRFADYATLCASAKPSILDSSRLVRMWRGCLLSWLLPIGSKPRVGSSKEFRTFQVNQLRKLLPYLDYLRTYDSYKFLVCVLFHSF